jgi:Gas vesicle protein G
VFVVDDIVFSPVKGVLAIFKEIYKAAAQEMADEADSIRAELSRLYQLLDSGELSDGEFDDLERDLLDRLDVIEAREATFGIDEAEEGSEDEEDEDEEEDDEDEEEETDLDPDLD